MWEHFKQTFEGMSKLEIASEIAGGFMVFGLIGLLWTLAAVW